MDDPASVARQQPEGWQYSKWNAPDGWPLRRYDWAAPAGQPNRGTLIFLTGRGDMPEKYFEAAQAWHDAGWTITGIDWRGQGGSGRLAADASTGHIDRFETWLDDLEAFWGSINALPQPLVILGHSMGGHLVLRALLEGRIKPDAAVLVAPMLGFETGALPISIAARLVGWAASLWPERKAWPGNEKPSLSASRMSLLTNDQGRYDDEVYWRSERPELVLGPPSLNWLHQANLSCASIMAGDALERCETPVLVLGTDGDALVSPAAIRTAGHRLSRGRLHMYGSAARHELLREADPVRNDVLTRIATFLDEAAPAP